MHMQSWIAFDQWLGTLWPLKGMADETISARAWRQREDSRRWGCFQLAIDFLALAIFGDRDHCRTAYASEAAHAQLPHYPDTP